MSASLLDLTLLHANDLVSVTDSAQPMSDNHNSLLTAADKLIQGLLHLMLTLSVEGRGGLIKKQELRFADERTSDGDSLLLTS